MKNLVNALPSWNERYLSGDTPWRHDEAHRDLIEVLKKYAKQSQPMLEIGCGTGEEAIEAAKFGFDLTAVDLAETAIEIAKEKAKKEQVEVAFRVLDFINEHKTLKMYQMIFDVTCMHTYKTIEGKRLFAELVHEHLKTKGFWINFSCPRPAVEFVEQATGVNSPPALTLKELAEATEGLFQLIELHTTDMQVSRQDKPTVSFPAWISVFKKL